MIKIKLEKEDLIDFVLLQKKVFFNLELNAEYNGRIVITKYREYELSSIIIEEGWPFSYVNNIHNNEYYLRYVPYIFIFVLDEKYSINEEYNIYLEFIKRV